MILSNIEVHKALDSGRLVIQPEPKPRHPNPANPKEYCPYSSHAVDLTLGTEITVPVPGTYAYDLMQSSIPGTMPLARFIEANSRRYTIDEFSHFTLERNQFVLAQTRESLDLPINHPENEKTGVCLAARIEGKSSRARVGLLVHFTAPTVHPGWRGPLTLEMINLGPARILLTPGMPIAQLIVEQVMGLPSIFVQSQFHDQTTPAGVAADKPQP